MFTGFLAVVGFIVLLPLVFLLYMKYVWFLIEWFI